MTNIFAAIRANNTQALQTALNANENFDLKNERGAPPIHAAIDHGLANIVYWLAVNQPFLLTRTDQHGDPALKKAIFSQNCDVITALHDAGQQKGVEVNFEALIEGETPLTMSIYHGLRASVECLVTLQVSFETPDGWRNSPLNKAIYCAQATEGVCAYRVGYKDYQQNLIYIVEDIAESTKQDLDAVVGNDTPLTQSAYFNLAEVGRILLDAGAHPYVTDQYNNTPLEKAIFEGSNDFIRMLFEYQDEEGNSIFDQNSILKDGQNPLTLAARVGRKDVVQFMLAELCFDKTLKNSKGEDAMHAANYKHDEIMVQIIGSTECLDTHDRSEL